MVASEMVGFELAPICLLSSGVAFRGIAVVERLGQSPLGFPEPAPRPLPEKRDHRPDCKLIKSTVRVVESPLVQLDLDTPFPPRRLIRGGPRCARIHWRPPVIPIPTVRTCCPPSPCSWLSHARTTARTPPHPETNSRRWTCPSPPWRGGGEGSPRVVPTFTIIRSAGEAPNYAPAASPRVRSRPSSWHPGLRKNADRGVAPAKAGACAAIPAILHVGAGRVA
jgi:hypothetical protein